LIWLLTPNDAATPAYELIAIFIPLWATAIFLIKYLSQRIKYPQAHFGQSLLTVIFTYAFYFGGLSLWLSALAQFPFAPDSIVAQQGGSSPFGYLAILFAIVSIAIIQLGTHRLRQAQTALRGADYTQAFMLTNRALQAHPNSISWLWAYGTVSIFGNQLESAEAILKRTITSQSARITLMGLANLAYTLSRQKRYAEAIPLFEALIKADSTQYIAYLGLAEIYLQQGIETDRVSKLLDLAEITIQPRKKSDPQNWAEILVDRAWLMTLHKRPIKADELIAQALKETSQTFKPSLALLNYRIGQIMVMRGDKTEAAKYFRQSTTIDPAGIYAQSSRDAVLALRQLNEGPPPDGTPILA